MLKELILLEGVTVDNNVIKNVAVCGLVSKNGYTYLAEALKKAAPLYENADVYANHKDKRLIEDKIGYLTGAKFIEGYGLGGATLTLNEKHPLYEQIKWWAKNNPSKIGLSHSVDGKLNAEKALVEEISAVESVDMVAKPATVGGLHESVQEKVVLDSTVSASYDQCTSILWDGKLTEAQKREQLADVMSKLVKSISPVKEENTMEWDKVTLALLEQHCPALVSEIKKAAAAHEKAIQESLAKVPADKRGKVLERLLREAKDEAERKELVDDRLELVKEAVTSKGKADDKIEEGKKDDAEVDEKKLAEEVRKSLGLE